MKDRKKINHMQLFGKIINSILKWWNPTDCDSHDDFKNNLIGFLENNGYNADPEYSFGHSRIDVLVNNRVGIEVKTDLTNSLQKTLRGQIDDYCNADFPKFIAVICRVQDKSAWRSLKKRYRRGKTGNGKPLQLIKVSSKGEKEIHPGKGVRTGSGKKSTGGRPGLDSGETDKEIWGQ